MSIFCDVATGTENNLTSTFAKGVLKVSSVTTPLSVKSALPFLHEEKVPIKNKRTGRRKSMRFIGLLFTGNEGIKSIVENKEMIVLVSILLFSKLGNL
jgi:hypothetical protein